MELTDFDFNQIENYFNQSLSQSDSVAFAQRLKTDITFQKSVNEYQATIAVLNTVRSRQEKETLRTLDASMPAYSRPIIWLNYKWLSLAAAVLVLIWLKWGGSPSLKSPIATLFEVYPVLDTNRGGDLKVDNTTAAYTAYKEHKYKTAASLFDAAFIEKTDTILLFYKGISELGSGEAQMAAINLEKLENSNIVPQQALYFYLGLAAAETQQTDKAIKYLQKAAITKGDYQIKSKEALIILEKKK